MNVLAAQLLALGQEHNYSASRAVKSHVVCFDTDVCPQSPDSRVPPLQTEPPTAAEISSDAESSQAAMFSEVSASTPAMLTHVSDVELPTTSQVFDTSPLPLPPALEDTSADDTLSDNTRLLDLLTSTAAALYEHLQIAMLDMRRDDASVAEAGSDAVEMVVTMLSTSPCIWVGECFAPAANVFHKGPTTLAPLLFQAPPEFSKRFSPLLMLLGVSSFMEEGQLFNALAQLARSTANRPLSVRSSSMFLAHLHTSAL